MMLSFRKLSWILFLLMMGFVQSCQTTDDVSTTMMGEGYFEREGHLQYTRSNTENISPESTQGDVVTDLDDAHAGGECNCSDVKVCPGKPVPPPFRGSQLATTPKIRPPQQSGSYNRFYHLRSCDKTPEDLAFFIWGDRSKADELVQSVGGAGNWKAGSVVKYISPKEPNDTLMQSFYADHSGISKSYKVKRGDSLASIAAAVYGDVRNWKELAIHNGLDSPDSLNVGQSLKLKYKE